MSKRQLGVALAVIGVLSIPLVLAFSGGVFVLGESAEAEVVDIEWTASDAGRICIPVYAYVAGGAERREPTRVGLSAPCPHSVGDRVRVYYWESAPSSPVPWAFQAMLPTAFPFALLAAAAWLFWRKPQKKASARLAETGETSLAAAKAGDVVKLRGRIAHADAEDALAGPLTGRAAVAWWARVVRRRAGEPDRKVQDESRHRGFVVRTADGEAAVGAETQVKLLIDADAAGSTREGGAEAVAAFLERHGTASEADAAGDHLVWYEGRFAPGEEVLVLGRLERDDAAARLVAPGADEPVLLEHVERDRRRREIPSA